MDIKKAKGNDSLASKSIAALKWNYVGRIISLSLQFTIGIILARMLGPEPFGLVAIAMFVQNLAGLFADGGLGSALIQSKEISEHDIRSVFWTQLLIGFLITFSIVVMAPLLATFFHEPHADTVIMAMGMTFLIQSIGQPASALLRRNLNFKKLQIIRLISYLIGYLGTGLPLAYLGHGVWSLVIAQLIQITFSSFATYFSHRHSLLPLVNPKECRFLRFGAAITINNITSWGIGCIDTAIIGRFFDTATLGIYNRAFNLVNMPMYAIVSSVQAVLLSGYAKTQDNKTLIRRNYLVSVGLMALFFLPIYAAVAAVADSLVLGIYGDKWESAIPLIKPLAAAIAIHAMMAMTGPMLIGIGLPKYELIAQIITLVISIPTLIYAAQHSLIIMLYALLGTFLLRFLILTVAAFIVIKESPFTLLKILVMPILIASLIYAAAFYTNQYQITLVYDVKLRLLGNISVCIFCYGFFLLIFRKLIIRGVIKDFLISLQNKLPKTLIFLSGI